MDLVIDTLQSAPVDQRPFEIVERKGLGHPDTICDALAEAFSRRLSRFYRDRFGHVAHHNVDKALLWGGVAHPEFGGGRVTAPMEIFLSGRVTESYRGVDVPVRELAEETCREWFRRNLNAVDPDRHVRVHCLTRPGSADLVELFARQIETGIPLANDTSCGTGFAPLSTLESMVAAVGRHLAEESVRERRPEIGEDVKVMGVRHGASVELTLACAFVAAHVPTLGDYLEMKRRLASDAADVARAVGDMEVSVAVNAGDDPETGSVYLTVTGTSAEAGDDGQVGRGNRTNGLITPFRPMTMEAAAGKNPVTHVGKLYNLAAGRIAATITAEIPTVAEAHCWLVSRIGAPIDEPGFAGLRLYTEGGVTTADVAAGAEEIVRDGLAHLGRLGEEVINGNIDVY